MIDLFDQGKNTDRILTSEHIETLLEVVNNLMDSLGLTFEQVTVALKLTDADKENLRIRM